MSSKCEDPFDLAVAKLYESVMTPTLLQPAMVAVAEVLGVKSLGHWRISNATGDFDYFIRVGLDESAQTDYAAYYRHIDPAAVKGYLSPVGTWVIDEGAVNPRIRSHREYYNDFMVRRDIGHLAGVKVHQSEAGLTAFSVQRAIDQDPFGLDRRTLDRLLPHLGMVSALRERFESLTGERNQLESAIHAFETPIVVVDASLTVRFMNAAAARACHVATGVLRTAQRKLATRVPEAQPLLVRALSLAVGPAPQAAAFAVPRGIRRPAQVTVTPLTEAQQSVLSSTDRLAMVSFEHEPEPHDVEILRQLFGLTTAEARVVKALASGESLQDIHDRTDTSMSTLRVQVAKAFQKCDVSSQTQLVALVRHLPTVRATR